MKLEFGVYLPAMFPTEMVKEWAITSEKLGFNSIWISDHVMDPFPPNITPMARLFRRLDRDVLFWGDNKKSQTWSLRSRSGL